MRKLCYTIGWAAIAGSVICFLTIVLIPIGIYLLIVGAGLVILTAIENWRYTKRSPPSNDDFVPTAEKYIDDETGNIMRVYYNPSTGERDYRKDN